MTVQVPQLSAPALDLADPGRALADIARLAYCGTPPDSAMAGIRRILTRQGPLCLAVPGEALWPVDTLAAGAAAGDAAGWLAGMLLARPGPFTGFVTEITRERPQIEPDPDRPAEGWVRDGTRQELADLGAWDEPEIWERPGTMFAGRLAVGTTRLRLLPGRVPAHLLARIRAGEPCGAVLGPYGMVRAGRWAKVHWPADPPVTAGAVLALDGRLIGFGDEAPSRAFVEYLARAATR